jgi:TolB-like protein/tetratricopeptide (TPR) repeat protein
VQHPIVPKPEQMPHSVPPDEVRRELDRILSSQHFPASQKRREFLRYIVEEALDGRADRLKGYSVALAVFGRDETFDPNADPVVRLEARRLRRDLDSYYVHAGVNDPVRISIPKGSYAPSLEWQHKPEARSFDDRDRAADVSPAPESAIAPEAIAANGRDFRRILATGALIATMIAIASTGWLWFAGRTTAPSAADARGPALVILPFEALGSTQNTSYLAQGIRLELVNNLFRFSGFRLYSLPAAAEAQMKGDPAEVGRKLGVTYVVHGSVRTDPEEILVAAQVVSAQTGQVIWTGAFRRPSDPQAIIGVQGDMASDIATAIGQPYGVVKNDIGAQQATPMVSSMQSYVCVLRAYSYRRSFNRTDFGPALQCLEQAVKRDPDYSDAWAMLGWLHVDAGRLGYSGDGERAKEYEKALQATSRAATLQPKSPLALKSLAATFHYLGRYDDSERIARQAAALNPNDPEVLAQLGWRLAVRGKFEEGIPILKRAIERTVNPPSWYYHLVAIDLYLQRDYAGMLEVSERAALGDTGFSQLLLAVANAELGKPQDAQRALERLARNQAVGHDPAGYMRRHGAIEEIVEPLMASLHKAHHLAAK